MDKIKQTVYDLKYSTETLLKQFNKLESNIKQSKSFGFYKLFSQMQLTKTQEKPKSEFPRLCNEHKNKPFEFFCIDHKQLLCVDFLALNHRNCNQVVNLEEGYEKIQNELEEKMNEEISIKLNEKYIKLNKKSMKMQKEIDEFNESEMIIKEIEICKKYNDYQQILINFFKLKKLLPILNKKENNKLICNSKFNKINIIPNDLKQNWKNWKLNLPF
ncbi:e3 ubiquitin-protein ligase trim [Anaeramoeba flamelloides]|uniref:E3 ubiquitin-protein ligase trim n=1 Tax=Anaeramoeba flamelloides TaxID=1746091 RepID=A0AAV7ZJ75_9EUKA|nr:e3 ubiquitin-protein ligase trim [Anaeramoeba flamelloides]